MADDNYILPKLEEIYDERSAQAILQSWGFVDWKAARTTIQRIDSQNHQEFNEIFSFLMTAISLSLDPERALINFARFLDNYGFGLFDAIKKYPRLVEILVTLFSASPFLTETLLRTPNAIDLLNERRIMIERKTIEQFQMEALQATDLVDTIEKKLDALRLYQRSQYLRIGTSDFLGLFDLRSVFSQLSRMAIGLVRACLVLAARKTGISTGDFVVLAMGKLGGWELNYSSDIDLLFVAKNNTDKYIPLAKQLIENIAGITSEGFLYRVDLRLRPWGKDGPLIITTEGYLEYIKKNARLWEKQAFFKARPIAGNISFGEELRNKVEPYLFGTPADEVRASIFAMKQKTEEFLLEKGRHWGEIKLGEGSIRDIEFIVQSLQLIHPSVRTRATLKAIARLREQGLLSPSEAHILTNGYVFLRTIEHYLQMIDYRQNYSLPSDSSAIARLARRLGFEGSKAGEQFIKQYDQQSQAIRSIFLKYVGNEPVREDQASTKFSPIFLQHIARMDASYTATFSEEEIQLHALLASQINNQNVAMVDIKTLDNARWRVTVVAFDYLGELSLICGLMFAHGLDIIESQIFTYEPVNTSTQTQNSRRKIVDVFVVRSVGAQILGPEFWELYAHELYGLLNKMQTGQRREAQGELAIKVSETFQMRMGEVSPLYPIDIEIDNETSKQYTLLKIRTVDTAGFLYEFTNALALSHINIARMFVQSIGNRVNDAIYITDNDGHKIISSVKQRELRAATVLIKHFTHLLPHSPNPKTAMLHFREFLGQLFERPNWPDELARIERPEVLESLAKLLGVSNFLWDDFLRMQYSNLFPVVRDVNTLSTAKARPQLQSELKLEMEQSANWRIGLNAYKDRELFRIDMRHILGHTPEFWDFAYELTDLAEVVISAAFYKCRDELLRQFGEPYLDNGRPCPATVFALGKCGGRELGFASDIELMVIYEGEGRTVSSKSVSSSDFYEELIHHFVTSIQARQEGIFHIDLQLRPYGKAGRLAVSLGAFQHYFAPQGPAWAYERQALIRLRSITGDQNLGERVSRLREEYVYKGGPFDVSAMRAMRERQIRHLVAAGTFNAKYSPGGLVDLEYLIQGLQITHGAVNPSLRTTNIRMAMSALAEAGILSEDDYSRLRKAHTFLRWLIDSLRVVRGNTKDVNIPPFDSEEFMFLARRLKYGSDTHRLELDLTRYAMDVQELNANLLSI